ncbi:MAG: hypothetical protein ABFS56_31120, partial [Pseudomonadota bacterium]
QAIRLNKLKPRVRYFRFIVCSFIILVVSGNPLRSIPETTLQVRARWLIMPQMGDFVQVL